MILLKKPDSQMKVSSKLKELRAQSIINVEMEPKINAVEYLYSQFSEDFSGFHENKNFSEIEHPYFQKNGKYDYFSFHTFQMNLQIGPRDYERLADLSFESGDSFRIYPTIVEQRFKEQGVIIYLKSYKNKFFYLCLRVNPRRLFESNNYLGIFHYSTTSCEKIVHKLNSFLDIINAPYPLKCFKLSRIDLCANIYFEHPTLAEEYIRLMHKNHYPPKFNRIRFNEHRKNKISFTVQCSNYKICAYSKLPQLRELGFKHNYNQDCVSILRTEVALKRPEIAMFEKYFGLTSIGALFFFAAKSELVMKHYLNRYFNKQDYCTYEVAAEILNSDTSMTKNEREKLLHWLKRAQQYANQNRYYMEYEPDLAEKSKRRKYQKMCNSVYSRGFQPTLIEARADFSILPSLSSILYNKKLDVPFSYQPILNGTEDELINSLLTTQEDEEIFMEEICYELN